MTHSKVNAFIGAKCNMTFGIVGAFSQLPFKGLKALSSSGGQHIFGTAFIGCERQEARISF